MIKHKLQSGYITCMDKPYIFTYDGELLQLVPRDEESIKPYDYLKNKNINYEVLEGNTIGFDKIFFLNCYLKVSLSGYIAKPAGYVCFSNNERKFDVITFRGGIIDYFYRPNQIIDTENTQYNYDIGGATLKLKTFDETSKQVHVEIDGKQAVLTLGVTLPEDPLNMQKDYNLGKPESIFRLTFNESVEVTEFSKIYMWIYNLMVFLNFRKNINMGQIELGKINEEKKIEKIGYVYLNQKDKKSIPDVDRIIGYYFVFNHLNELLQIVNKENLNLLFIPKNEKDGQCLSPEKYMICCTSFESVFNYMFLDARIEYDKKAKIVKEDFLQYIKLKREEYKGEDSKIRKEFEKYANIIKLLDFSLAEKFEFCNSRYVKSINEYKKKILWKCEFDFTEEELENLSEEFAKKRNMFIHSSIEDFEDIHIFSYLLARVFIYIMILNKANIESSMIIQAIDKIL